MALSDSDAWQTAWADPNKIPLVDDDSWKSNLAVFFSDLTSDLLKCKTVFSAPGTGAGSFTFNSAAFMSGLSGSGAALLANAFEAAILASTMVVATGAFIAVDSNPTKFSVISSTIIDPPSIAAAKAYILAQLASLTPVAAADESQLPVIMRAAFLMLTVTITGLDSTPPTAGPLPLTASGVALQ